MFLCQGYANLRDRTQVEAAGTPGWQPVPVDYIRAQVTDERDRAWLLAKLTPNPIATSAQPIWLRHALPEAFPRTFVFCTEGKGPESPSAATATQLRHDPSWRYREVAANHLAPVTTPLETAQVLLDQHALAPVSPAAHDLRVVRSDGWLALRR